MPLNWNATKDEHKLIRVIAERINAQYPRMLKMGMMMDIESVHCNGCKLRLPELSKANDGDLFHDVIGIYKHLNRRTGKLENCFSPRYSA